MKSLMKNGGRMLSVYKVIAVILLFPYFLFLFYNPYTFMLIDYFARRPILSGFPIFNWLLLVPIALGILIGLEMKKDRKTLVDHRVSYGVWLKYCYLLPLFMWSANIAFFHFPDWAP
jgi:hypothetical protein